MKKLLSLFLILVCVSLGCDSDERPVTKVVDTDFYHIVYFVEGGGRNVAEKFNAYVAQHQDKYIPGPMASSHGYGESIRGVAFFTRVGQQLPQATTTKLVFFKEEDEMNAIEKLIAYCELNPSIIVYGVMTSHGYGETEKLTAAVGTAE